MPQVVKVFVSYGHQDQAYLAEDNLLGFLQGLTKDHVELWTDRRIRPGELWDEVNRNSIRRGTQHARSAPARRQRTSIRSWLPTPRLVAREQ